MGCRRTLAAVALLAALAVGAAAQEDDIPALVRQMGEEDGQRRVNAYSALQQRKDPRAIPLILAAMPGYDFMSRYYAMFVLDAYPQDLAEKAARSLVGFDDPYVQVAAATTLLRFGDQRAVEVIVRGLRQEGVTGQARLYMLNRLYSADHPRILEAVRTFVRPGEETTILGQALDILANRQDRAAVPPVEALLEKDDRPGVRALAAAWLLRMGDAARAEDLAREIREGKIDVNEFFRVKNLLTNARQVPEVVLEALLGLLESEANTSVLSSAVDLLAKSGYRKAAPVLKRLLTHENRLVAKAAFDALAGFGGILDKETLIPLLTAEDADRRLWASDALRRMDDTSGLGVVTALLREGTPEQRRDAARILGGFADDAAVAPLIDALADEDLSVRSNAQNSLLAVFRALFPYRRLDFASVGWQMNASETARAAAVEKIRAWWSEARRKPW